MKIFGMKDTLILSVTALSIIFLESCSDDSPTQTEMGSSLVCSLRDNCPSADLKDDFALVRSSGKTTVIGTNNKTAKVNERTEMDVKFDYDYQLGLHKVTCG